MYVLMLFYAISEYGLEAMSLQTLVVLHDELLALLLVIGEEAVVAKLLGLFADAARTQLFLGRLFGQGRAGALKVGAHLGISIIMGQK